MDEGTDWVSDESPGNPRDLHRRAGEMAARLIDRTAPEQFGLPTPCSEWNVRAPFAGRTVPARG